MNDYYELLGVDKTASQDEIKKSFRKLAKEHHPDVNQGNPESEKKFKEINQAYEVLSDPQKRQNYDLDDRGDNSGQGSWSHTFTGGFGNLHEAFFNNFFNARQNQKEEKQEDIKVQITISLKDAFSGFNKNFEYERMMFCERCDGKGSKSPSETIPCHTCNGSGTVHQDIGTPFNSIRMSQTCPTCGGAKHSFKNPCPKCHGKKSFKEKNSFTLEINKGIKSESLIVKNKMGHKFAKDKYGDLYVRVIVQENDGFFTRFKDDVIIQMPLPFSVYFAGGEISVPTLHGVEKVVVGEKQNQIRIKNKGFSVEGSNQFGDEVVNFSLEIPAKISDEVKKMLKEMPVDDGTYPGYAEVLKKIVL
jgi:molecular chaperone DnaJ